MFTFPINHFSSSGVAPGQEPLGDIISSCCMDIDATIANSFTSGLVWKNIEKTPADSESQTAYDWDFGDGGDPTTDNPAFTGTAGNDAAHMLFDGGDHFSLVGGNTELINSFQQTSGMGASSSWISVAFRLGTTGGFQVIASSKDTSIDNIEIFFVNTTTIRVNVERDLGIQNNDFTVPTMDTSTDLLLIISMDPTSTDDIRLWLNSDTAILDTDAHSDVTAVNTTDPFDIGRRSTGGGFQVENGFRLYHFGIGNSYLDDTDAAAIRDHLQLRHAAGRY